MDEPCAGLGRLAHLIGAQMHPVREDRARGQGVERRQPLERPGAAAPTRVVDVGPVLGDMDMDDGFEFARQRAGFADRLVGYGKARVQPDEPADERRGRTLRQASNPRRPSSRPKLRSVAP